MTYTLGEYMAQRKRKTKRKSSQKLTVKQLHALVKFLVVMDIVLLLSIAVLTILLVQEKEKSKTAMAPGTDYIVCLDAGHGGSDIGATGADGRYEKDDNLKLTLAVAKELEKRGVHVVLTRDDDSTVSSDDRSAIANESGADLFLALHRNFAASSSACGVEAWIHSSASDKSYDIASSILEALESIGISKNRGVKTGTQWDVESNYTVIRQTTMTSLIIEVGFISNEEDLELFDRNLKQYAQAIADCIVNWLNQYAER